MNRLTLPGRILVTALIIGGLWGLKWLIFDSGHVLKKTITESQSVSRIDLPDAPKNAATAVPQTAMPTDKVASLTSPEVRWQCWAWNAQMGLLARRRMLDDSLNAVPIKVIRAKERAVAAR